MTNLVLNCKGIVRRFDEGVSTLFVLRGIDMQIHPGERVAIIGASGSGKTTLLQIIGGLDDPDEGEVFINKMPMHGINEAMKGKLRNQNIGFIYQFHHLLPEFTAVENVAMPLMIRRYSRDLAIKSAEILLDRVGLNQRFHHKPGELSGGERQRVAVARALITRPSLVLADEPTGNLDSSNGEKILKIMLRLNKDFKTSLIVVTHDRSIAKKMDRIFVLENGELRLVDKNTI
ncbi:MAG: lipoprotein-releasing system ATP-binding protein LolD [Gammaproteobacteria bacterium]|nr:lipoprotein-releasing system ATP-binding protein LolD [Gammaproteobacteria bacterium]|tara:strand:- start:368 stop:1063 length:696 start_codon:yes stop_codon:yes gene_type:complete